MEVTDDLVMRVARLSRLGISPREVAELKDHFRKILAYVAAFQTLDTKDVDPSFFALDASNVYRADEVKPCLRAEDVLRSAPRTHPPFFVVPRIVGDAGDAGDAEDSSGGGEP